MTTCPARLTTEHLCCEGVHSFRQTAAHSLSMIPVVDRVIANWRSHFQRARPSAPNRNANRSPSRSVMSRRVVADTAGASLVLLGSALLGFGVIRRRLLG